MTTERYRFVFAAHVPTDEVEAALALAILATESQYGTIQARLDIGHAFDPKRRACVIDAGTTVGRDLTKLFARLVAQQFGEDVFTLERIDNRASPRRRRKVAVGA